MPLTITSFSSFASHLLAARQRSTGSTAATSLAQKMARDAEEIVLHFTHPGRARDDAVALFWQVAPLAFADPDSMQGRRSIRTGSPTAWSPPSAHPASPTTSPARSWPSRSSGRSPTAA